MGVTKDMAVIIFDYGTKVKRYNVSNKYAEIIEGKHFDNVDPEKVPVPKSSSTINTATYSDPRSSLTSYVDYTDYSNSNRTSSWPKHNGLT